MIQNYVEKYVGKGKNRFLRSVPVAPLNLIHKEIKTNAIGFYVISKSVIIEDTYYLVRLGIVLGKKDPEKIDLLCPIHKRN